MAVMQLSEPKAHRWTRKEYYELAERGFFHGRRVLLMDGEILQMPPQGPEHFSALDLVAEAVRKAFPQGHCVRTQAPLDLGVNSDPEPDVAVVSGKREDYFSAHPQTAVLVVESSDSTLAFDRGRKASLYARGGIADYWIINLVDRQLEIRRKPVPDSSQDYGYRYADVTILFPGDSASPLAAPQAHIRVADLLP
jgi:Uma2 family endonuclease